MKSTAKTLPALTALFLLPLMQVQASGSGSQASESILTLDEPLVACAQADTALSLSLGGESVETLDVATQTEIWALSFDQTWVEISVGDGFFYALSETVTVGPCDA